MADAIKNRYNYESLRKLAVDIASVSHQVAYYPVKFNARKLSQNHNPYSSGDYGCNM